MNRRRTQRPQAGFTIIELLIATSVFSVIILIITVSILQFSKQYYKGIISSSTQSTARTLVDDVSRSIEFNSGAIVQTSDAKGYCVGTAKRYSFALNHQVTDSGANPSLHQSRHGLVSDSVANCSTTTTALAVATMGALPATGAPRELLGQHMRLAKFSIVGNGNGLYLITVRVIYGDDDLLNNPTSPDAICKSTAGSQFCAAAELTTTVKQRI